MKIIMRFTTPDMGIYTKATGTEWKAYNVGSTEFVDILALNMDSEINRLATVSGISLTVFLIDQLKLGLNYSLH